MTTAARVIDGTGAVTGERDLPAEHRPAKPGEQLRSSVDPAKATRLLGWHPEVGLREGLEKTLGFFGAL